jgi:hypothetical protein
MTHSMLIWTGAVTLACAGSALWMRMQPVYEPGQKPRFSILGLLVGQTMSWVFWMLVGFAAVSLWQLRQAHADWRGMHVVYGVLCGIGFAIGGAIALLGAVLGFIGGSIGMTIFFATRAGGASGGG